MSEHIWSFKLPNGLEQGAHLLEVRAKDEFGLDAKAYRIFVVE